MQCPTLNEWELFTDCELPAARKKELEYHLDQCPACFEKADLLKRESILIHEAIAETAVPADLETYIRGRLNAGRGPDNGLLWLIIPATVTTGLYIASAMGLWSLLETLVSFIKLIGGASLAPEIILFLAGALRELAEESLQGQLAVPALTVIVCCILWIKLIIRRGGHAHA